MARRVAIIGGGVAGIAAAFAARETGTEVVLLERQDTLGGSGRISGGLFWAFRDFGALRDYMPEGDADLQRLLVERFPATLDWFADHGATFGDPRDVLEGYARGRSLVDGTTGDWPGPFDTLHRELGAAGVDVRTAQRVGDVRATDGGWLVASAHDGTDASVEADAVVIASGGYHRDRERLARYVGPYADRLLLRSGPGSTGDGLRIGERLGGGHSRGHGSFYGHTMPDCPIPSPQDFHPMTAYYASSGVLVDRQGRRFTDETAALNEENNPQAAIERVEGIFYGIFTDATIEHFDRGPGSRIPTMRQRFERARELGTPTVSASTLHGLAEAMAGTFGVDAHIVERTVEAFNDEVTSRATGPLEPPRRARRNPLDTPTFHAIRCVAAITATYGGLRVDDTCRLLDDEGAAVPNTWVAGADAGGVFNRRWAGGLAWALVSGRVAGAAAARG